MFGSKTPSPGVRLRELRAVASATPIRARLRATDCATACWNCRCESRLDDPARSQSARQTETPTEKRLGTLRRLVYSNIGTHGKSLLQQAAAAAAQGEYLRGMSHRRCWALLLAGTART